MNRPLIIGVLLVFAMLIGVILGQVDLFPLDENRLDILLHFRLPRVLFAAVNGAVLALAGALYQIVLRNPMADGFTTGAASSAAFGGCLALVLWGNPILVSLAAIVSASLGVFIIYTVSKRAESGSRVTIILAGIALSVIAASGISFLKYFFEDSVNTMVFWLMGGLSGATPIRVAILSCILFISLIVLIKNKQKLALLFLDDNSAETSGVNVKRARELLFILTTVLVAVSVSFCGTIGFLGLMVPHAVRGLMGHNITVQLVGSTLLGALALVMFDLLSRTVLPHGGELPVGVITSLAGGGFFFFLLMRKGGAVWGR